MIGDPRQFVELKKRKNFPAYLWNIICLKNQVLMKMEAWQFIGLFGALKVCTCAYY